MVNIIIIVLKGKLLIFEIDFTNCLSNKRTSLYDERIWNNTQIDGLLNFSRRKEMKTNLPI